MLSCGGRSRSRSLQGLTQSRDLTEDLQKESPHQDYQGTGVSVSTLKSSETEAGTGSATHQQHSSSLSSHPCSVPRRVAAQDPRSSKARFTPTKANRKDGWLQQDQTLMGPTPLAKSFKTQPPAPNCCCVLGALRDEVPLLPPHPPAELHGRLQHRAAMIPSMRNGVSTHRGKL